MSQEYQSYSEVKARLDEIVSAVDAEDMPLDEALALYEEAVRLGMRTVSLIEEDAAARAEQAEQTEQTEQTDESAADESAAEGFAAVTVDAAAGPGEDADLQTEEPAVPQDAPAGE